MALLKIGFDSRRCGFWGENTSMRSCWRGFSTARKPVRIQLVTCGFQFWIQWIHRGKDALSSSR